MISLALERGNRDISSLRYVVPGTPVTITDHEEHLLGVPRKVGNALYTVGGRTQCEWRTAAFALQFLCWDQAQARYGQNKAIRQRNGL